MKAAVRYVTIPVGIILLLSGLAVETLAQGRAAGWGAKQSPASGQSGLPEKSSAVGVNEFDPHWLAVGVYTNAAVCANCHKASTDGTGVMRWPRTSSGKDVSPSAGWRHSMMAQAWADPYFQATLEDQAAQFPGYAGDIEDKCLTCHSPMAHSYSHDTGIGLSTSDCSLDGGCYRMETTEQENHAREGVSCTLCHQMVDDGTGVPGSGSYAIPGESDAAARTLFGPYPDPLSRPMQINTDYTVSHSDYISSSEHCGSCHDLSTPTFDVNTGHPAEPAMMFREQAAYSEWLNSTYGDGTADDQSCQDCHMPSPENGYSSPIAVRPSGAANAMWPERGDYAIHGVAGGNTYVLGLLKTWREELGIAASTSDSGFAAAIEDARELLSQSAQLSLLVKSRDSQQLRIDASIDNLTGHKLPTGYPSRRMWLQLTVIDQHGAVVFESGRPDKRGFLAIDKKHLSDICLDVVKQYAFRNSRCYERHHDVITRPEQVAVYESVMADINGNLTYSLLYGAGYLKDNRIPPAGFSSRADSYDKTTAILGEAIDDTDFNRVQDRQGSGADTVHYRIVMDNVEGPVRVQARLWYQSIRPAFVDAMAHGGRKVERMQQMFDLQPPLPELLASASLKVD